MKLWLLVRKQAVPQQIETLLIRARNENDARMIAVGCDWRNPNVWNDSNQTDCSELSAEGNDQVLDVTYG